MRVAALLTAVLSLSACHALGSAEESRPAVARDFPVAGSFDKIALSGSPNVIVTVGGAPSIRAEGSAVLIDRLEITNDNGQLRIGLRSSAGNWFHWGGDDHLTVHVTLPVLAAASIAGSGDIRVDRVQGPTFSASVTGSGDLSIASLTADQASFTVTGSGDITAAGRAQQATASVTGSGDLHLTQLEAQAATLAVVGSGDIGIRAMQTAAIDIRGSGDVTVAGPARCTISKAGSGDAHCGG